MKKVKFFFYNIIKNKIKIYCEMKYPIFMQKNVNRKISGVFLFNKFKFIQTYIKNFKILVLFVKLSKTGIDKP